MSATSTPDEYIVTSAADMATLILAGFRYAAGADLTGRYLDGENNVAPAPAFIVAQWIASAYGRDAEALSYLYGYRKLEHLRAAELVPC